MAFADRIPLKMNGVTIGTATVRDDGTFIAVVNESANAQIAEVFDLVKLGFVFGISLSPIMNPALDGRLITRLYNERPLTDFGGFNLDKTRAYVEYHQLTGPPDELTHPFHD